MLLSRTWMVNGAQQIGAAPKFADKLSHQTQHIIRHIIQVFAHLRKEQIRKKQRYECLTEIETFHAALN